MRGYGTYPEFIVVCDYGCKKVKYKKHARTQECSVLISPQDVIWKRGYAVA